MLPPTPIPRCFPRHPYPGSSYLGTSARVRRHPYPGTSTLRGTFNPGISTFRGTYNPALLPLALLPPALLPPALIPPVLIPRHRFGAIIVKRIYTLQFDRSSTDSVEHVARLYAKLTHARSGRHVVCSTPESLKSLFLKFVEQQLLVSQADLASLVPTASTRALREVIQVRDVLVARSAMADALYYILQLWRQKGLLIMDEVDVLLHPLRSELNFPLGQKEALSSFRWEIPMFIIDGIFFRERGSTINSLPDAVLLAHPDLVPRDILLGIQATLDLGLDRHCIQRFPHVVLLDEKFYHQHIKPWIAKWVLLWLHVHFIHPLPCSVNPLLLDCLCDYSQTLTHQSWLETTLAPASIQLLNLASDWVRGLLPHCLSKIDRVSFGILSPVDLVGLDPNAPLSRRLLAVPFLGKDVPSRSSEFAHPDVLIGLTVLAYRYEGSLLAGWEGSGVEVEVCVGGGGGGLEGGLPRMCTHFNL